MQCTFGHGNVAVTKSERFGLDVGFSRVELPEVLRGGIHSLLSGVVLTEDGADDPKQGKRTVAKMSHLC